MMQHSNAAIGLQMHACMQSHTVSFALTQQVFQKLQTAGWVHRGKDQKRVSAKINLHTAQCCHNADTPVDCTLSTTFSSLRCAEVQDIIRGETRLMQWQDPCMESSTHKHLQANLLNIQPHGLQSDTQHPKTNTHSQQK